MAFPAPVQRTAFAAITFLALLLFAVVFSVLIVASFLDETPAWIQGDFPTSLATALAGLVGGVVAIGLGQTSPGLSSRQNTANSIANVTGLITDSVGRRSLLAYAYVYVYLILGVAAIITSVVVSEQAPDSVKNLASIFVGLVIPIARGYFSAPTIPASQN
jgi:hypothetical protein